MEPDLVKGIKNSYIEKANSLIVIMIYSSFTQHPNAWL